VDSGVKEFIYGLKEFVFGNGIFTRRRFDDSSDGQRSVYGTRNSFLYGGINPRCGGGTQNELYSSRSKAR
jgi:hypothetical protein